MVQTSCQNARSYLTTSLLFDFTVKSLNLVSHIGRFTEHWLWEIPRLVGDMPQRFVIVPGSTVQPRR